MSLFLPDGTYKILHYAKNVIVSPTITLHNTLYAPHLKHNLIFIHKLAAQNNAKVTFCTDKCWLQNQLTKVIIGKGTTYGDLYFLEKDGARRNNCMNNLVGVNVVTEQNFVNADDKDERMILWHNILGHLIDS